MCACVLKAAGSVVCYCLPPRLWLRGAATLTHIWQFAENTGRKGGGWMYTHTHTHTRSGVVTLAARVMLRSFITSSNAAVSSACFWLCNAIFSLNFRGLFEVAMFRSPAPFCLHWSASSYRRFQRHHFRLEHSAREGKLTVKVVHQFFWPPGK